MSAHIESSHTLHRKSNMFLPFIHTAMDAACLNQAQMICAYQRGRQEQVVHEEAQGVTLKQLNNLSVEP